MKWLEVSICVGGELAEAVAELFARYAPEGVALEWLPGDEHHPHEGIKVTVYVPVEGDVNAAKSKVEEGLWHLGQISPLPEAEYRLIEDGDWKQAWRDHYQPIPVGESLLIIPAWMTVADADRHPIILEPGMAFGTGSHDALQKQATDAATQYWIRTEIPRIPVLANLCHTNEDSYIAISNRETS